MRKDRRSWSRQVHINHASDDRLLWINFYYDSSFALHRSRKRVGWGNTTVRADDQNAFGFAHQTLRSNEHLFVQTLSEIHRIWLHQSIACVAAWCTVVCSH